MTRWVTMVEAARLTGFARATIQHWALHGAVRYVRVGPKGARAMYLLHWSDLQRLAAARARYRGRGRTVGSKRPDEATLDRLMAALT